MLLRAPQENGYGLYYNCTAAYLSLWWFLLPSSFTGDSREVSNKCPTWKSLRVCFQWNLTYETTSNLLILEGKEFNDLAENSTQISVLGKGRILDSWLMNEWQAIELHPPNSTEKSKAPCKAPCSISLKQTRFYTGPNTGFSMWQEHWNLTSRPLRLSWFFYSYLPIESFAPPGA